MEEGMMKRLVLTVALLFLATPAFADLVGTNPPASLLVVRRNLEWVWASPCAPFDPTCAYNQPLQMHHGFQIATESDWSASFTDLGDVYAAFNPVGVPYLCGSAYFNSGYTHCDPSNITGFDDTPISVWNAPEGWGSTNTSMAETFVVRDATVPEPASLLLLGTGLFGVVRAARRRMKK
jgi:hypothetical protein